MLEGGWSHSDPIAIRAHHEKIFERFGLRIAIIVILIINLLMPSSHPPSSFKTNHTCSAVIGQEDERHPNFGAWINISPYPAGKRFPIPRGGPAIGR
jgi:hypothetical protein